MPAFKQCLTPNTTHVAPLTLPSCDPPQPQSNVTTLGSNGAGSGFVKLTVVCTDGQTPPCNPSDGQDTEDVTVTAAIRDVVCRVATPGCSAPGADYTGPFFLQASRMRITDHAGASSTCSNPGGAPPCAPVTLIDNNMAFTPGQCADNGGPNGGVCNLATSWDAGMPGSVREGQGAVVELNGDSHFGGLSLNDAGLDNNLGGACPPFCATPGDEPIGLEGAFAP